MRSLRDIRLQSLSLGATVLLATAAQARPPRANIVVILSDDMGFSDIGCYGSEIATPNLDRLAAGGLRFTQFYNTARCCPTRASLLTGLYPHQADVGHMIAPSPERDRDGYRGNLRKNAATIAEALKPAGYRSYMAGKWHVTSQTKPDGSRDNWPRARGFDRFYGTIVGAGSYFDPAMLVRDETVITAPSDPEYKPERYYYTDAISDHAVRFISDHRRSSPDAPFFLYVAYTAAHWPLHALEEDVTKQRGKYDAGYEAVRRARWERLQALGVVDPTWTFPKGAADWESVKDKAWEARCMEVYAAQVDRMDQGIGRIVQALEREGIIDDTLVLFLEDNGGCAEEIDRNGDAERPGRVTLPAMRTDEPFLDTRPKQTRDGRPMLGGHRIFAGPDDTFLSYGLAWANVSNTPFREYKHWVHEGGIATPLIAHWPKGIESRGALRHEPGHVVDILPTCLDAAQAVYPPELEGRKIIPCEGKSLLPAFEGRSIERDAIFWEHEGNRAVRQGRWKLVARGPAGRWELYDLAADRTEMRDLESERPELVKELTAKWEAWARRTKVIPWIWKPQYGEPESTKPALEPLKENETRFDLAAGDDLPRSRAPKIGGRSFRVIVEGLEAASDGVVVAQGGGSEGFSLFAKDGKLCFAMRRGGKLATLVAPEPLGRGPVRVEAELATDGRATLTVNGKVAASGAGFGPLNHTPQDGLQVGRDSGGAVGDYKAPFAFTGRIGAVRIDVRP